MPRLFTHSLRCPSYPRYLLIALLALGWSVPYALPWHTYPISTFYPEFVALALYLIMGLLAVWLISIEHSKATLGVPYIACIPIAFGIWLLLQTVLQPLAQPSINFLAVGFLSAVAITVQLGSFIAQLKLTEKMMRWSAFALLAGGIFAVFCQLTQALKLENLTASIVLPYYETVNRRLYGNMAQANHLATYLSFAMAAALFLVQTKRLPLLIGMILSTVYASGHALAISRTSWLQIVVIAIGGVMIGRLERQRIQAEDITPAAAESASLEAKHLQHSAQHAEMRFKHLLQDWLAPTLLLLIFVIVNGVVRLANQTFHLYLADAAIKRFHEIGQLSPRLALWRYGWTMFNTHPWLGVGWGEFPRYTYTLVDKLGQVEIANNSHNILIDLLAKTGIGGVGLIGVGLGWWLWRTTLRPSAPKNATRVFCLMLLAVLAVHALFEYPQQYLFFLLPAAFLLGMLETGIARCCSFRVLQAGYLALVSAGLFWLYPIWLDYQRVEGLYYGTRSAQQYRANPARLFGAWGQYGLTSLLSLDRKALAESLAMHEQALTLLPSQTMLKRYAVLLALAGREEEALAVVQRLKQFSQALRNWPAELKALYALCDEQGAVLASFKKHLVARYKTLSGESGEEK